MHISPSWQRSAKARSGAIIWRCADPARTPEAQDWRVFHRDHSAESGRIALAGARQASAWQGQGSLARRGRWLRRLRLGRALLIKRDEIDRIAQQRRAAHPVYRGFADRAAEMKHTSRR